jgi:hypothetical protein
MANIMKSIGEGLRIAGSMQNPQTFRAYNAQNEFDTRRQDEKQKLVLGLLIKGVENGVIDQQTFKEKASQLGYGDVPNIGQSIEWQKLEEEKRQADMADKLERDRMDSVQGMVGGFFGGGQQQPAQADPEVLSDDQVKNLLENDQNPYIVLPEGTPEGIANQVISAAPSFGKTVLDERTVNSTVADVQTNVAPGISPEDAYKFSVALASLDKETAARVKDYGEYLYKNQKAAKEFGRGQRTADAYGVWTNHDGDYEYELVRNDKGELVERRLSTAEANEIRNKGRESAANKTTVNAYEPAQERAQREQVDNIMETFSSLEFAPVQVKTIRAAKKAIPRAAPFTGSFAETKLKVVKFFNNNFGTRILPSEVASSEELRFALFNQIMDNLKKLDATPSQMQQRIMMESMGNLGTDPQAMYKILDLYEQIIYERVDLHNKKAKQAQETVPDLFITSPIIGLPPRAEKPQRRRIDLTK